MGNLSSRLSATNSQNDVVGALVTSVLLDEAAANPTGSQTANRVLAGPASGSAATPTFRALVSADIPNLITPGTIYSAAGTPLPAAAAGLKGVRAVVSDATTPTFLASYVSGGAVVAPVLCIGTDWVTA